MKKYFFMAFATLAVSTAAVVGGKAYNYYSMPELMRANLEALSNDEDYHVEKAPCYVFNPNGMATNASQCDDRTTANNMYSCKEITFFPLGIEGSCVVKVNNLSKNR